MNANPLTPSRPKRQLHTELSDPKLPDPAKRRLSEQPLKQDADTPSYLALLDEQKVPKDSQQRLLPLMQRWGPARAEQVLSLWAMLGDGLRSSSLERRYETSLQVWGAPGTGKTEIVSGYLKSLDIRHVWLNCFCISSQAELHGRIAKLLSREALLKAASSGLASSQAAPVCQNLRPMDRLQAALREPLDTLERAGCDKVVVVLDHIEELSRRLGTSALELLLGLPEVLHRGEMLSILTIGRVPLQGLGLLDNREPPEVEFQQYSLDEVEKLLMRILPQRPGLAEVNRTALEYVVSSGILKFAVPYLGRDLLRLLEVGVDVLGTAGQGGILGAAKLKQLVEEAAARQTGFLHSHKVLDASEDFGAQTAPVVAASTAKRLTKAEMRLILAAYLASRVDKQDDRQLFLPDSQRRRRRVMVTKTRKKEDQFPASVHAPRAVPLTRVLAIYHRLARKSLLIGSQLFERISSLREAGLLRGGERSFKLDRELKVICRAELYLARACAKELKVDLAEYLCK
mmetsp:Transcript_68903/g.121788  ORF Transcript_68903/g.121788 Transcript_68903/m.121788 type:complete len:515 (+) Transcript_68903:95-1639(+)|eukprot:CAMPEP_0197655840 /NCGR_PEP_ID=MMETSP1338-20131121/39699_1 /TAXON_ID=43686 ORGANISM="Pelagodinium beii, Strain RCC1491" /NCGR_SAMPLE_ID=MMETSP1338 /ASSEMBLY_ACC=CAM_ASM_000754 /LENGTH=514 /DNA_ID=CAMNT_0043231567 /DNA_START=64 /DNA_END=1608 /DNA_ORIENTATION=-